MISGTSSMDKAIPRPRWSAGRIALWVGLPVALAAGAAILRPVALRWSRAELAIDGSRLRLAKVVRGDFERDVSVEGRIVAALHPTLFSRSLGIAEVLVKAGQRVKKGEPLVRILNPELTSRLSQERALLASQNSELKRAQVVGHQEAVRAQGEAEVAKVKAGAAQRALDRAKALSEKGWLNVTEQEKARDDDDLAQLEWHNAQNNLRLSEERLRFDVESRQVQAERQATIVEDAERQVAELTLAAPFDAMVAQVYVQDRDAVQPNQPIVNVVTLDAFEVEVKVAESETGELGPGTKAEILHEGKPFAGHLTAISPEIKDGQVVGTVVFDGPLPPNVRQNQRVQARLLLERETGVLKLPRGPFLEAGGGKNAYVVSGGLASLRPIHVGAVSVSEVELLSGLEEGEQVVISDPTVFAGAQTVLVRP